MRRSLLLIISAAVNIMLLAVLLSSKRPTAVEGAADSSGTRASSDVNGSRTRVVVRKQSFSWSEVESPDYIVYIGHLREIGCPEQTIRDIVIADVDQLYSRKRLEEVPTLEQEWWRSTPDTNLFAAARAKEQSLDQERRTLLNTLLGPNWKVEDATRTPLPLNGPVLGDLSPETKQAVRDVVARSQKQIELLSATHTNQPPAIADLARLELGIRADLAKILTPAQLEEFLLRYSSTAADLRYQLRDFDVTPEAFRKMFELRDPIVQKLQLADTTPATAAVRAAMEKQLDDAIQTVLGPEQFRAYQLAKDPDYREAVNLATEHNAPTNVVDKLYQVKQLANQERQRISQDASLTPEQKAAQLKAVDQQVQAVSNELLGLNPPEPPPQPPMPPPPAPAAIHAYYPGETMDMIAAKYGVSVASIMVANPDLNLNALARGTPIKIPAKPQPVPPVP